MNQKDNWWDGEKEYKITRADLDYNEDVALWDFLESITDFTISYRPGDDHVLPVMWEVETASQGASWGDTAREALESQIRMIKQNLWLECNGFS